MPFFVTPRIIEGLGLGLARRAARKLVPVVLTLGFGPIDLPEKIFSATVEASATTWEERVARARFRNFGAGSLPVGLPETTFRATAEASATSVANPRRRSRALCHSGAGGWPVGLPETIFRVTANCDSLPRARFRRFGAGGWPDGLPETNGQISKFGLRMADFILSRIRSLSAAKPSHFYQGLAEWEVYQGRPAAMAVYQSRWQLYQAGQPMAVFSRIAALSRLRTRPVAAIAIAVLSIRSVQVARSVDLGCGWSISYCPAQAVYQRPGRAFLQKAGKANGRFIKPASRNGRFIKASLFESFFSKFSFKAPRKASCSFFASCAAP